MDPTQTFSRTLEEDTPLAAGTRGQAVLHLLLECDRPLAKARTILPLDPAAPLTVGRGKSLALDGAGTLHVPDAWMSSQHASIGWRDGRWWLEDPGSKNGSRVNGAATRLRELADGDLVELGRTFFLFREGAGDAVLGETPLVATAAPAFAAALAELDRVARSAIAVLLEGETGTGKEVLARALHKRSGRRGELVAVNCAAIAPNLLEAQLFGHERGAFSGADRAQAGLIRAADGGTLFLDEVGELPPPHQAALLRVLQEHEVLAVGATRPVRVDLRVVAATNRPLALLAARGGFREDLLARLAGFSMTVMPLRERREDLGALIAGFLGDAGAGDGTRLLPDAARALLAYPWPRNVRELEQAVRAAVVLAAGQPIGAEHLPAVVRAGSAAVPAVARGAAPTLPPPTLQPPTLPTPAELTPADADSARRGQLVAALERHAGNVSEVGRELGWSRQTVHRWLTRYGLAAASFRRR